MKLIEGQRVKLSPDGEKVLLPQFRNKSGTGVVVSLVTESGDIVCVQRDGVRKWDTTPAAYWQPIRPTTPMERTGRTRRRNRS